MTDLLTSEGLDGDGSGPQPGPVVVAPSLLDQVTGVFTEPVALFQRLRLAPVWKGALGLSMLLTLVMTLVWGLKVDVDAMLRPVLEQQAGLSPEQLDRIIEFQGKFLIPGGLIMVVLVMCLGTLLFAWLYWLIAKGTAEGEQPDFGRAVVVSVVPNLVVLPKLFLVILMCLVKPINGLTPEKITPTSLGYFLSVASPKLQALLYRLDIFTIAALVLLFLAARHTLRLKVAGAAACTALATLILVLLPALLGK